MALQLNTIPCHLHDLKLTSSRLDIIGCPPDRNMVVIMTGVEAEDVLDSVDVVDVADMPNVKHAGKPEIATEIGNGVSALITKLIHQQNEF